MGKKIKKEGLTAADVMQEEEGKKHLPLGWKKAAQKKAAEERGTLTTCSPPRDVSYALLGFFSKQKVQVQTLLLKFLSRDGPQPSRRSKRRLRAAGMKFCIWSHIQQKS